MNRRLWIAVALLVTALAWGCATVGASPTPTIAPPTETPQATATPPATPTITASASPTLPRVSATPTHDPDAQRPPTTYLGNGTVEVAGELRTFCWLGTCADAFELPPKGDLTSLEIDDPATELSFRAGIPFNRWAASYSPRTMDDLAFLDDGGALYDPDISASVPATITEANVTAPPPGDWIVYIVLNSFENEAHYVWRVQVP